MKKESVCLPEKVVESRYCTVLCCPHCKSYYLQIGPMSLRLKEEVFMNICRILSGITFEHVAKQSTGNVEHMRH